jgi:hypothetical protein
MEGKLTKAMLIIGDRCGKAKQEPLPSEDPAERETYLLGLVDEIYQSMSESDQQEIKRFVHWLVTT